MIATKLDNVLALGYPSEKLDILVVSDGSDDNTEAIVHRYSQQGVRLLALPRRGKVSALNSAVPRCGHAGGLEVVARGTDRLLATCTRRNSSIVDKTCESSAP